MTATPDAITALHAVADLMDRDDQRCRALYGAPVGIPPSMGDHLITVACTGTSRERAAEWVRIARQDGLDAAAAWAAERQRLRLEVTALIYPRGIHTGTVGPDQVRAIAGRLTGHP